MCCLASAVHPLTDRAEAVYAQLATYAERATAAEILGRLINRSGGNPRSTLLCVDLLLTEGGFTERFLRSRGDWELGVAAGLPPSALREQGRCTTAR